MSETPETSPGGNRRLVLGSKGATVGSPPVGISAQVVLSQGGVSAEGLFVDRGPGMRDLPDSAETLAAEAETAAAQMADILLGLWAVSENDPMTEAQPITETFARAVARARESRGPAARLAAKTEDAGYDDLRAVAVYLAAIVHGATAALRPIADTIGLDPGEDW